MIPSNNSNVCNVFQVNVWIRSTTFTVIVQIHTQASSVNIMSAPWKITAKTEALALTMGWEMSAASACIRL